MKCLIIDAVHSAISEELSKYMQVDTHMLPTQEELLKLIPDYPLPQAGNISNGESS